MICEVTLNGLARRFVLDEAPPGVADPGGTDMRLATPLAFIALLLMTTPVTAAKASLSKAASAARARLEADVAKAKVQEKEQPPRLEVAPKRARNRRPRGAPKNLPFRAGETLHYKLTWMGISVGEATFTVGEAAKFQGKPAWTFAMTARTNGFADRIYRVRDKLRSWTSPKMTRSVHHTKIAREGSYHRDIIVTFDWKRGEAVYQNSKRSYAPRKIQPGTFDPLAVLYGFRCQTWKKPGSLKMSVTDGLKTIRANVQVHKREEIEIGGELIDTWKVTPELKDVGGIFKRSKNATMEVWVSTDRRHIPLRLRSKVMVGSFTATLVEATGLRR